MVMAGTAGTALALVLYGLAHGAALALVGSVIAGASWITVLASLNVSAQSSLPDWVRGRGLAMFVTAFFGAMTLGSIAWGKAGQWLGLADAQFLAAAGAILAIPLTRRWKLVAAAGLDLAPSMHWPPPVVGHEIEQDRGPVMVTVEYHVEHGERAQFLAAIDKLSDQRRRDGAYAWGVFEDAAVAGRFLETFLVESWLEHLRQHERVTNADRVVQDAVQRFQHGEPARVSHWIEAGSEA
jgi:branched-subunit amino acid transport protein